MKKIVRNTSIMLLWLDLYPSRGNKVSLLFEIFSSNRIYSEFTMYICIRIIECNYVSSYFSYFLLFGLNTFYHEEFHSSLLYTFQTHLFLAIAVHLARLALVNGAKVSRFDQMQCNSAIYCTLCCKICFIEFCVKNISKLNNNSC